MLFNKLISVSIISLLPCKFKSKYKFQQECKEDERPPFPSSLTYDSKAWSFMKEHANKNALFWNVGK